MKFPHFLTVIYSICFCMLANAQAANILSDTESAIVDQVNKGLPLSLQELEQVVNINSGTMNFPGVKKVGLIFHQQFEAIGFETRWIEGRDFDRAGHLVASYGDRGPKILMIGHLDTVFEANDKFQSFKHLGNNRISGPGIIDMKGGDVIIISALRTLKKLGLLNNVRIQVVMTGDEERSGEPLTASKKVIIDGAKWADIALGFENGDSNIKTAVVARRGYVSWLLEVTGKPAHSSQIFREDIGYGSIFETARILNDFREQLSHFEMLTFNPGLIIGGTEISYQEDKAAGDAFGKSNIIAKTTQVTGDIRTLSYEELANAQKVMQEIVANNLSQTSAKITFSEGYPPMARTVGNERLLAMYDEISQSLGYEKIVAVNPRLAGAADISFAGEHVEMALDGLGLMGAGAHTRDEVADITSLAKNIHKAAILIHRLSLTEKRLTKKETP
ncbi:MAG: M20/M25/M40 family metallo-hydrolase [Alteromonadaceae bacterium]|nr:M20/M25/M40 family metallo-hydrolase [Alteromonadaceae bacterium]